MTGWWLLVPTSLIGVRGCQYSSGFKIVVAARRPWLSVASEITQSLSPVRVSDRTEDSASIDQCLVIEFVCHREIRPPNLPRHVGK